MREKPEIVKREYVETMVEVAIRRGLNLIDAIYFAREKLAEQLALATAHRRKVRAERKAERDEANAPV